MNHLDEGTVLAVRDESAWDEADREHLDECDSCLDELAEARARADLIAAALGTLDDPVDTGPAKAAVRARLDASRAVREGPAWRRWHLGRAAAILLVTAGAVSALPGSPMRSLWEGPRATPETLPAVAPRTTDDRSGAGIAFAVVDGSVGVILRGVTPGTEVEVVWVDGSTARIRASAGSVFAFDGGTARADVTAGPVRIDLPRSASVVSLRVDDELYVRRSPAGLDVPGPSVETTETLIRFRVPGA